MTNDEIAAFIAGHMSAWNRRNPKELCLHHAHDGVVVSPMFGRVEGQDLICKSYRSLFTVFPDFEIRFDTPISDGIRVAVPFSATATHQADFMGIAASGKSCVFEGVSLYEISPELLIAHERRVYDFTGLLTQLGVLRVRPGK